MAVAAARPLITVYGEKREATGVNVPLPSVFKTPIRPDVVTFIHHNVAKNSRQPYAVSEKAGHQTSAESWGTGRAVARIPRVRGGGTHRSGQGAFGNMCRGGRMFAPTKTWRRWHRKVNLGQKRYAICSAIAASGIPALVMAKGHAIQEIPEVPLVITDKVQEFQKTKQAVLFLRRIRAWSDVAKVYKSRRFRAGKGKMRNRRRIHKLGPLIIYDQDRGITRSFRNIPGVELLPVDRLNLLKIAPGGHLGRFVIWTESAFKRLDEIYGTWRNPSTKKSGFNLPAPKMTCTDLTRLLRSEEIKKVIRKPIKKIIRSAVKKNPLKNVNALIKLNPYAAVTRRAAVLNQERAKKLKAIATAKKLGKPIPVDKNEKNTLKQKRAALEKKLGKPLSDKKPEKKEVVGKDGKKHPKLNAEELRAMKKVALRKLKSRRIKDRKKKRIEGKVKRKELRARRAQRIADGKIRKKKKKIPGLKKAKKAAKSAAAAAPAGAKKPAAAAPKAKAK